MADPKMPDAKTQTLAEQTGKNEAEGLPGKNRATMNMENNLGQSSRNFFSKMSEKGKSIVKKIYARLDKIPGKNLLVEKIQIAMDKRFLEKNQRLIDKQEQKAVGHKGKMDGLDVQVDALSRSKESMEAAIGNLKELGMPGAESLQLEIKKMEQKKAELLSRKDKQQSELESSENKAILFTEKRDNVADRLIEKYDKKLIPIEKELDTLESYRDEIDLLVAGTEMRHRNKTKELASIEDKRVAIIDSLRKTGWSDKKINSYIGIKALDTSLKQGYDCMKKEKEALARKREEVNAKIAKAEEKANPHRDKREKFIRAKEGRPLEFEVEKRKQAENFSGKENVARHKREKEDNPTFSRENEYEISPDAVEENAEGIMGAGTYIAAWNKYLRGKYAGNQLKNEDLIFQKDFIKKTVGHEGCQISADEFKFLLDGYTKKRPSRDKFQREIDEFLKTTKK